MSKKALKNGHAEHIHANCDCQYAVRFDGKSTVEGYDPDEYLEMYENAEGSTTQEKLNSMRRQIAHTKKWTSAEESAKIEARKTVGLDESRAVIRKRINQGQYNLNLSDQQYLKHIEGTAQYQQYATSRVAKGRMTISYDEAQKLIKQYAGKGTPDIQLNGTVGNKEYATANDVIGQYCNSKGEWLNTKRFAIHYGERKSHCSGSGGAKWLISGNMPMKGMSVLPVQQAKYLRAILLIYPMPRKCMMRLKMNLRLKLLPEKFTV
ncbi:MAG: polymorphic toxin type 50 domain-containing protein [Clostridiales bacterium]|nr:polymorphic toxin type 50 domain-containing protein [Clostridiales bacterium]